MHHFVFVRAALAARCSISASSRIRLWNGAGHEKGRNTPSAGLLFCVPCCDRETGSLPSTYAVEGSTHWAGRLFPMVAVNVFWCEDDCYSASVGLGCQSSVGTQR